MKYEKLRSLQHTRATLREIEHALMEPEIKVGELALLALLRTADLELRTLGGLHLSLNRKARHDIQLFRVNAQDS